ncbi:unnamed protein product [Dovyalis caffra]|uniref:50S ribosomal protein L33, chloroplastic n=1 Tax=Dovyalis caffra TaxID=77055 RepID=A0AAV1R5L5_9ROSI|nr:unnamed protein product [Dovyalis caffra]
MTASIHCLTLPCKPRNLSLATNPSLFSQLKLATFRPLSFSSNLVLSLFFKAQKENYGSLMLKVVAFWGNQKTLNTSCWLSRNTIERPIRQSVVCMARRYGADTRKRKDSVLKISMNKSGLADFHFEPEVMAQMLLQFGGVQTKSGPSTIWLFPSVLTCVPALESSCCCCSYEMRGIFCGLEELSLKGIHRAPTFNFNNPKVIQSRRKGGDREKKKKRRRKAARKNKDSFKIVRLVSAAGTGYVYAKRKGKKSEKLEIKKYDPDVKHHVIFKESK